MTETKQVKPEEKPKFSIPKPFSQALLAGSAAGIVSLSGSLLFEMPADQAFKIAVSVFGASAGFSFVLSWRDSRLETAPKKKRKRSSRKPIPFNHARGSQKITFDYAMPNTLTRETYAQAIVRKLTGNRQPIDRRMKPVERPGELDEFVFHSQGMQLREVHIKLFLKSAWCNRKYGKGLSDRHWRREFHERPAWYQELSPLWYYATMDLLRKAGQYTHWHLIVEYNNGWRSLVSGDLRLTMSILRWYEYDRRKQ